MLVELFKDKLISQLNRRIINCFNREISDKNSDEYGVILEIINEEELSLDDINYLIGDNICYDVFSLSNLVSKNNFSKKFVKYIIYKYLVINSKDREIKNLIVSKLGYEYSFDDINLLNNYINDKSFINNDMALSIIDKVWNFEKDEDNSLFREKINKLYKFKKMIDSGVFPDTLIDNFVKVKKYKNLYYQLVRIEEKLKNSKIRDVDKLFILWTYNYMIDDDLKFLFEKNDVVVDDLVKFIKRLEDNGFILSETRVNNLLNNFKNSYYIKNKLVDKFKFLSNKVIGEYSKYYDENYYFKMQDFIDYYNKKYNDDFGKFIFCEEKVLLNLDILNSIFEENNLVGNYFLYRNIVSELKTFRNIKIDGDKYNRDQELFYLEKKKFYKRYKCKINEFVRDESVCFKHFMVKNIDKKDRIEFYELFKKVYKDNCKELEQRKGTLRNSAEDLKKDFVLEVLNNSFRDRFVIKDKYIDDSKYIGCNIYIKDDYYDKVLVELERQYRLLIAREIVYRLGKSINDKTNIYTLYEELNDFVRKEFKLEMMDALFNELSRRNRELKEDYFEVKRKLKVTKKDRK